MVAKQTWNFAQMIFGYGLVVLFLAAGKHSYELCWMLREMQVGIAWKGFWTSSSTGDFVEYFPELEFEKKWEYYLKTWHQWRAKAGCWMLVLYFRLHQ